MSDNRGWGVREEEIGYFLHPRARPGSGFFFAQAFRLRLLDWLIHAWVLFPGCTNAALLLFQDVIQLLKQFREDFWILFGDDAPAKHVQLFLLL